MVQRDDFAYGNAPARRPDGFSYWFSEIFFITMVQRDDFAYGNAPARRTNGFSY
jgi:hypothetical protein